MNVFNFQRFMDDAAGYTFSVSFFLNFPQIQSVFLLEKDTFTRILYHRAQRPGRPPLGPPLLPPLGGGGLSHCYRPVLLSLFGRPVLRAAGLAGGNCRVGSPADGQTAKAGAVRAWAAAAGPAVRPLWHVVAWTAPVLRIPASPAC
jgi:hypothetical protein